MIIRQYLLNCEDLYCAALERDANVDSVIDDVLSSPCAMNLLRDLLYSDGRAEIREVIDDLAAENTDVDEEDEEDEDADEGDDE